MGLIQNIIDWFSGGSKVGPSPVDVIPPGDWVNNLLKLHNSIRPYKYPLTINAELMKDAQDYVDFMAAHPNKFSHVENGTDVDRANRAGYNSSYVGENIAKGGNNEQDVFTMWKNSAPHYANIMNTNYKDVGFGMSVASNGTKFWCAVFGRVW